MCLNSPVHSMKMMATLYSSSLVCLSRETVMPSGTHKLFGRDSRTQVADSPPLSLQSSHDPFKRLMFPSSAGVLCFPYITGCIVLFMWPWCWPDLISARPRSIFKGFFTFKSGSRHHSPARCLKLASGRVKCLSRRPRSCNFVEPQPIGLTLFP